MGQRVLGGQEPAPRVAEQEEAVRTEAQRRLNLIDLVDEPLEIPQRKVIRLVAVGRSQLVVVVVLDPGGREEAVHGFEVLVRAARAAVEQEELAIGLLATRFVQTAHGPDGVSIGTSRAPPERMSVRPLLSLWLYGAPARDTSGRK